MADKKDAPSYKYRVDNLAEDLGVQAATVRVLLRKHEVKKTGDGVYGWNSQADYKAVLAQLKSKGDDKSAPKTKAKAAPAKKPRAKADADDE